MVGAARFELATSCTPSKRASRATLRPDRNRNPARADTTGATPRINHEDWADDFLVLLVLVLEFFQQKSETEDEDEEEDELPSHPLLRNRVRRVAVKRFRALHQRLGQRRVRMHREGDVLGRGAHLYSEHGLGNQL